jgi:hypothetical protein
VANTLPSLPAFETVVKHFALRKYSNCCSCLQIRIGGLWHINTLGVSNISADNDEGQEVQILVIMLYQFTTNDASLVNLLNLYKFQ